MFMFLALLLLLFTCQVNGAVLPFMAQPWGPGGAMSRGVPDFAHSSVVTRTAVADGAWRAATTWSGNIVPQTSDVVLIPNGINVTIDDTSALARTVGIKGVLKFHTQMDTRLTVHTVLVYAEGALEMGSVEEPVHHSVSAEMLFRDQAPLACLTCEDPEQYGLGLIVIGRVRMHGSPRLPTFSRLRNEVVNVPTTTLEVRDIVRDGSAKPSWRAGDRLLLPDHRQTQRGIGAGADRYAYEEVTLAGTQVLEAPAVGTRLTLNAATPVTKPQRAVRMSTSDDTQWPIDTEVELGADGLPRFVGFVLNMERNVILRSAQTSDLSRRGHTFYTAYADVDIRFALFKDLGRTDSWQQISNTVFQGATPTSIGTNQIARYAAHMHHVYGPTPLPAGRRYSVVFLGNVIDTSPKWGLAIHDTHHGLFAYNILYKNTGAGLMTEDGNESFNRIEKNFALRTEGSGRRAGDANRSVFGDATEGAPFWFRGHNNWVANNVGSGSICGEYEYGFTFTYFTQEHKTGPNTKAPAFAGQALSQWPTYDAYKQHMLEFNHNEAAGNSMGGGTFWSLGSNHETQSPSAPPTRESWIAHFSVWHAHNFAVFLYPSNMVRFSYFTARFDAARVFTQYSTVEGSVAFTCDDYRCFNTRLDRTDVRNGYRGINAPWYVNKDPKFNSFQGGTLNQGAFVMKDAVIASASGFAVTQPFTVHGCQGCGDSSFILKNVKYLAVGKRRHVNVASSITMSAVLPGSGCGTNYISTVTVLSYDHQQVAGNDFQSFFDTQTPDFIVPLNDTVNPNTCIGYGVVGSPEAGKSNTYNWNTYGIAMAGRIAPCQDTTSHATVKGGLRWNASAGWQLQQAFTCPIPATTKEYECDELTCPNSYRCEMRFGLPECIPNEGISAPPAVDTPFVVEEGPTWVLITWHPKETKMDPIDFYSVEVSFDNQVWAPYATLTERWLLADGIADLAVHFRVTTVVNSVNDGILIGAASDVLSYRFGTNQLCGNGQVDAGEQCDGGDHCNGVCTCVSGAAPRTPVALSCTLIPTTTAAAVTSGTAAATTGVSGGTSGSPTTSGVPQTSGTGTIAITTTFAPQTTAAGTSIQSMIHSSSTAAADSSRDVRNMSTSSNDDDDASMMLIIAIGGGLCLLLLLAAIVIVVLTRRRGRTASTHRRSSRMMADIRRNSTASSRRFGGGSRRGSRRTSSIHVGHTAPFLGGETQALRRPMPPPPPAKVETRIYDNVPSETTN